MNSNFRRDRGVMVLEWIILSTIVVIGLVAAISAMRDSLNVEYADTANAVVALQPVYATSAPETASISIPKPGTTTGVFTSGGMDISNLQTAATTSSFGVASNPNPTAP